jgi:hypothetical protein
MRKDFSAEALRAMARRTKDGPQARRLLALAAIYDGATRSEAAKIGGVTLQIVRDWVLRFNAAANGDEGGGYYDSGYIEPLDFFGDGTRIPLIAVSPYSLDGRVVHDYADHASILKFIERNWRLPTITRRSRDNLPNPVASAGNPYVPKNSPAIDDLFSLFRFK